MQKGIGIVDVRRAELFLLFEHGVTLATCVDKTGLSYRHIRAIVAIWMREGYVYRSRWAKYDVTWKGSMVVQELKQLRQVLREVGAWR
jgi:predicted transcriptional regulator